ncbi:beta-ketoacyl-[acyl-carrier-protein] synthase family protein [Micromonospora sp. NPDC005215]|uniref:beta-ketoacyl-[acyl-carrier-protein] synthase family protein n=1 Tax=Micromonospora sp. NPDC005215 TaxID=3157024 RepID=UPI0033AFEDC4
MTGRVVVTGMGVISALGVGAQALHERAVAGDSGLADGVGRCDSFDWRGVLTRREAHRTDRFCQFAIAAAHEALDQAGWGDQPPYPAERVGCVIGSAIGGIATIESQLETLRRDGPEYVSPLSVPMLMANAAAAQLAIRYQFRGEASSIVAACSGGAQAIGAGLRAIRTGEADAVVVGGAEAALTPFTEAIFRSAGALSPTGRSVPFDQKRDGFLLGEGAAVLVLESADAAERRGAVIVGEVLGYGATTDAYHLTAPEPNASLAAKAVSLALADAQLLAADIDYINAHGTGTVLNDQAETRALRTALGEALTSTPISSSKSYLGHLLGAAGAVEAVATLQALRHRTVPPTHGLTEPDERLGPLTHVVRAASLPVREGGSVGLSTSFGFGGHNVALLLRAAS